VVREVAGSAVKRPDMRGPCAPAQPPRASAMSEQPAELSALLAAVPRDAREHAWSNFVRAHSPLIMRVARRLGGDHDIVMDRYVYVLERLRDDGFRRLRTFAPGRCSFTTWLVVVSRRMCYDRDRERYGRVRGDGNARDRSRDQRAERKRLADLIGTNVDLEAIVDSSGLDPEWQLRHRELRYAVEQALRDLSPEDRLLLRLRFDDGLNAREIAGFLGLPSPFHVYRRLQSVLSRLRLSLRRRGIDDAST